MPLPCITPLIKATVAESLFPTCVQWLRSDYNVLIHNSKGSLIQQLRSRWISLACDTESNALAKSIYTLSTPLRSCSATVQSPKHSRRFVQVESPKIKPRCAGLIKLCSTKTMPLFDNDTLHNLTPYARWWYWAIITNFGTVAFLEDWNDGSCNPGTRNSWDRHELEQDGQW